ncbi:MipA/OmpV family protein [Luteibacter aegosomaticola]|uniref:MipA/OmpV family protein n=1 Tax=Luteibacter aegosomaticola TaxID=2911538 RepID=UPI001FF76F84|nr:MipA/OmpV family protein [Luteibacter aegosomaticola]UPG89559.1 MipA/OmpV family protein [Luteibacter aegosomaticola]
MRPFPLRARHAAGALLGCAVIAPAAFAQDTAHGDLGVGVVSRPEYIGSNRQRTNLVPVLRVELPTSYAYLGNRYGGNPLQLGFTPLNTGKWIAGVSVSYQNIAPRKTSDGDYLHGLKDIDRSVLGGFLLGYRFRPGGLLSLRSDTDLSGHGQGTTITLAAQQAFPINDHFAIVTGPRIVWGNRQHNTTYFGVDTAKTPETMLPGYHAPAGFQEYSLNIGVRYATEGDWVIGGGISAGKLLANVKDSPVVKETSQVTASVYAGWHF